MLVQMILECIRTISECQGLITTCRLGKKKKKREHDEPIVIKLLHLCGIVCVSTYFPTVRLKA